MSDSAFAAAARPQPLPNLFRDMLDRLPVAAYACDAFGLITYFNQKAVEVWGRAPALQDPGDRFCGSYRLFSAEGNPIDHDACWMALALQHRREYLAQEIQVERPNGSLIPVLAYATPLLGENGEVAAGINMLVNISERKRFERLLDDANETKNQYMATLADELRTQIAAIGATLAGLEHSVAPGPIREAVDLIQARMRDMGSLVNDLLAVSPQALSDETAQGPHLAIVASAD